MQKKAYRKIRYRGLSMIFYLFVAFGCSHKETSKSSKPNVIIIMTDDQGYGDMSCNGHPTLKSQVIYNYFCCKYSVIGFQ